MKKIIFSLILVFGFIFLSTFANAEDEEVRKLTVDIQAKGFTQTVWKNDLTSQDIIFAPQDKFQVKVVVKNEGNRTQTQINLKQLLPSTVTSNNPPILILSQIAAGSDYTKEFTVTVKDKTNVFPGLTQNSLRFTATSEVGTYAEDYLTFFTNGGTKSTSVSTASANTNSTLQKKLPATGPSDTIFLGSIAMIMAAFAGVKIRRLARGY
jgi:hypothetical protein